MPLTGLITTDTFNPSALYAIMIEVLCNGARPCYESIKRCNISVMGAGALERME